MVSFLPSGGYLPQSQIMQQPPGLGSAASVSFQGTPGLLQVAASIQQRQLMSAQQQAYQQQLAQRQALAQQGAGLTGNSLGNTLGQTNPLGNAAAGGQGANGDILSMLVSLLQMVVGMMQSGLGALGDNANQQQAEAPTQRPTTRPRNRTNKTGNAGDAGNAGNAKNSGKAGNNKIADDSGNAGNSGNSGKTHKGGKCHHGDSNNDPGTTPGTTPPDNGGTTPPGNVGGTNPAGSTEAGIPIPTELDFRELNATQRTELGLDDRDRAVLHLWGRQMIAEGKQNGAILNTVMDQVQKGQTDNTVVLKPAEVSLAQELIAKDTAEYGGVTGKSLDQEFFRVFSKISGKPEAELAQKYGGAPLAFANGKIAKLPDAPVDSAQWEQQLEAQNGLNGFENTALRLWGHDPLFNGGKIDGSVLAYTLNSSTSLDKGINKDDVRTLLSSDLAIDGVVNGDSMKMAFDSVLDKLYNGGPGTTAKQITTQAEAKAQANGRTVADITQSVTTGMKEALTSAANQIKDHPVISAAAVGGLATAAAVCPFLAGMGAGAMAIGAGAKMLQKSGGSAAAA
jgi:hypothetical protein